VRKAAVKMGRIATDDFTTGNETNLAMLEAARLAYVACTRARDHLVVCLHHGRRAKPNSAAELVPHLPAGDGELNEYEATTLVARPPVSELSDRVDRPDHRRTEWRVRSSWSATQLRHANDDPAPAVESSTTVSPVAADAPADVPAEVPAGAGSIADSIHSKPARPYASLPDQIGRYGTRVGRAVHGAVQTVSLHDPRHELAERVRQQCVAEEVPERLHEYVLRLVESILASELFARMADAATVSTVRREMYVGAWVQESDDAAPEGAMREGVVPEGQGIYGIIDAVWMENGRFVVVDFKTDHVLEEPATLAARYRTQLDAYARALRAATGREVAETLLCVALPDGSPAVTIAVS
jgi:ATP-dependent exoDNAse (exonuclease V) beta subunit